MQGMGTRGTCYVSDWIKTWIAELSEPNEETSSIALCPFAKKAWNQDLVKVVQTDDIWQSVHAEVFGFGSHEVVMCIQENSDEEYLELELRCDTLNNWFSAEGRDIWLLSYQMEKTIVFVQALSKLDSASGSLKSLGYYENYSPEDYERLVNKRRVLRERCDNATVL